VLTLGILALVTLLLVAFVTSMRVENMASKNFNDLIKARQLAQGAVDQAVATIRQATVRTHTAGPPASFSTYVTFPGLIYTYVKPAIGIPTVTATPLYTWNASDPTILATGFDLNDASHSVWITGNGGELGSPQINVGWIYVGDQGHTAPGSITYPISISNPGEHIIGRFAYWVDDDASKINVNTADNAYAGMGDLYGESVPRFVDLAKLLPAIFTLPTPPPFGYGTDLASGGLYSRAIYPYTTIAETMRANVALQHNYLTTNQFSMTTCSSDAGDLDSFGQPRLILSGLTTLNDIDTLTGLGAYARMSDAGLPGLFSTNSSVGTFATKYNTGATPNGLKQLIANIIAYQINPTVTNPPDGGPAGLQPTYLGLAKTPYINEVQLKYAVTIDASGNTNVTRTVSVELFYMYDGSYPATADSVTISGLDRTALGFAPTVTFPAVSGPFTVGSFPVVTAPQETHRLTVSIPVRSTLVRVNYLHDYGAALGGLHRLDYAQMNLPATTLNPNVSPFPPTFYQGSEAQDPAANESDTDWTPYPNANYQGTLNGMNTSTYPAGHDVSKAFMRALPMQTIGELGYIHTATPWQYVTLQPGGGAAAGQIPDWAMLDMFTVGSVIPNVTVTTGRININSIINNPVLVPPANRMVPLKALFSSLTAAGLPSTVPADVYNDVRPLPDPYGMSRGGVNGIYDTVGEVCEIQSLIGSSSTQKDKEATIRRIANLITVRSNTFTIWAVAQSIKQPTGSTFGTFTPSKDLITGEVKVQAIVERYEDNSTFPATVKFRTKYLRYFYQ
jgi:hypothetical protein